MQTSSQFDLWEFVEYRDHPKQDFTRGIHPAGPCLRRLYSCEHEEIPRLTRCPFAPEGLKQAVIASQPERIAARQADLLSAVTWELKEYGVLLIDANPYFFRNLRQQRKAAAA